MSEKERVAVADAADMIVNNYAFTKDGANVRVLNLRTGAAALLIPNGRRYGCRQSRQTQRPRGLRHPRVHQGQLS